ncbi:MAG TPA: hypothetical protein VG148_05395 [Pyrinomonadaceae bacterium]|nr:hypothetical protein [Pyrinomonadaceae bacterium]
MSFSTIGGSTESGGNLPPGPARACAACGAAARRAGARFCETCGRRLDEDYFPTESLRASYSFERRPAPGREREARTVARPAAVRARRMSVQAENRAAATGLAFVTYALVPYLGILFCPGALVMGGLGLWRASRSPHAASRRAAALCVALGLVVLCVQLVLWWVLYKVPEWTQNF